MAPPNSALLVIDMQQDFCLPGAVLCVKGATACLPKVIQAVELARQHDVPLVWVIREHHPSGLDVEKYRAHLFEGGGQGATVKGTPGAALVEGLAVGAGELVVAKPRFSGFFATNLDLLLRRLAVGRVVLCGVQTPNCIRATAYDGVALDYEVSVLGDATASASEEVQAANLHDMRCAGIATPSVADWAAQLAASPGS